MISTQIEPFDTPTAALVFAFNHAAQQYAQSAMAKMMGGPIGSGRGLGGLDGAGQVAFIKSRIEMLSDLEQACIVARFCVRHVPCPCCKSQAVSDEFGQAVERLTAHVVSVLSGLSNLQLRRVLVARYFGEKEWTVTKMAEKCGVHKNTATNHFSLIKRELKRIEAAAQGKLSDSLVETGMVLAVKSGQQAA